ncbi:uncharacterized protein isoform X2 [Rhodnius prolixus]|uniref:uncharacterized protein isoform X2 n=1 Tax=Rhodnius prolixus TaxID=13249 RepID=UPI003D18C5A7
MNGCKTKPSLNPYWYFKPFAMKRETFRKFLEKSGILGHITRTLTDLYDTPKKPPYPLQSYFRKHFFYTDPETPNLELLLEILCEKFEELELLQKMNDLLRCELYKYDEEIHLEPFRFLPVKKYTIDKLYTNERFWDSSSTEIMSLQQSPEMKRKSSYKVKVYGKSDIEVETVEAVQREKPGDDESEKVLSDDVGSGGDDLAMEIEKSQEEGEEEEGIEDIEDIEEEEDVKGRLFYETLGIYQDLEDEQDEIHKLFE